MPDSYKGLFGGRFIVNLFDLIEKFAYLNTPECQEKINIAIRNIQTFFENFPLILEGFVTLPERVQVAAKKWAEYGWAPSLPGNTGIDFLSAVYVPETENAADEVMLLKLEGEKIQELFDAIKEKVDSHNHNTVTYKDAVSCFNNAIYTGCALSLFALIDACFVAGQPKPSNPKSRRKLAGNAVKKGISVEDSELIVITQTVKIIIEDLFSDGDDFDLSKEHGVKRSFISHGMNQYNPNKIDCIKLFVLLYNIYLLFESGMYHWEDARC